MNRLSEHLSAELMTRILTEPGSFFLSEWEEWRGWEGWSFSAVETLWEANLQNFASDWGRERIDRNRVYVSPPQGGMGRRVNDQALELINGAWVRLSSTGVLPIGEMSIADDMSHLPESGRFASTWAVTDANDRTVCALSARFDRTHVIGFLLLKQHAHDTEFYELTGTAHYHVIGDPRNADLQTFMKHVDEWAAMMTGLQLSRGGRPRIEITALQIIQAFQEESTFVDATKLSVANNLGISVDTLNRRLKELRLNWPPINQ